MVGDKKNIWSLPTKLYHLQLISDEITNKTELSMIYHKAVSVLQNARHEIAMQHQPQKAHLFGVRRYDSMIDQ